MTVTLTGFLLARIAEDEEVARAAAKEARGETWHARNYEYDGIGVSPGPDTEPEVREIGPIEGRTPPMAVVDWRDEVTDQITRWSPARVLAECEAKRRLVEWHVPDRPLENWYWPQRKCAECGGQWHVIKPFGVPTEIGPEQGCRTLRALALPYADHGDYRDEWRP